MKCPLEDNSEKFPVRTKIRIGIFAEFWYLTNIAGSKSEFVKTYGYSFRKTNSIVVQGSNLVNQGGGTFMGLDNNNGLKVHIRWMLRRDIPEVLNIEKECFEFPWSEDDFIRCLRQRNCIGMVAEHDEKVVGFMIYELPKTKIHLLNIATAVQYRRQGVATQMAAKLVSKLANQRRNKIVLEVRETNLNAQLFLRDVGFKAVSVLKNFYEESHEDAYSMQYRANTEYDQPLFLSSSTVETY